MLKENNYLVLPSLNARLVSQYLKEQNIEHSLLSEIEMVNEGISPSCVYRGRFLDNNILCIKSSLTNEEILKIDEKTRHKKLI